MSSKKPSKPTLHYTPHNTLPTLNDYKTDWDLDNLYYKTTDIALIEADTAFAEQQYRKFARKWRKSNFTTDTAVLKKALHEYVELSANPRISKPGRYFRLRSELNVTDIEADKAMALLHKRLRVATDEILFFTLELGKIEAATQKQFLADPLLLPYRYFLQQLFTSSKYDLSEAEEKIIRLKSMSASGLWHEMTEKIISTAEVSYKKKSLPLPEAIEVVSTLPSAEKPKLWSEIITKVDSFGIVAEHEFNAIITDTRTEDDLRGYKKPYSATALSYQHDEKSIESVVAAVSSKGFALSQKFYKLKAKYHGVPALHYSQKYDSIGESPIIPFREALTVCRDVFYQVNQLYGEIFDDMLKKGQLDVYPKKGKRGGAFMSNQTGHPIQVMLNQTDTMKGLETLAHEMGHAIHAARSSTQGPLYDGHSIVTAETASTLFENLVFDAIFSQADQKTKLVLLHDKIAGDIATMQRQIAFFNCELEIHNTIHEHGAMSHVELRRCMQKHLKSYLGDGVAVEEIDGSSYIMIPHLRYGFYVYSYTFGNLMSTIMANHYKEDNSYREKIDTFLTAGESDTVVNIFKKINITTTKPDTFLAALANHEKDISTFAKLLTKNKVQ